MKKCPICELNWIDDNEEMCSLCQQKAVPTQTQVHKPKPNVHFNEIFTFKSGDYVYDDKRGFKAYNSKGEHVGIVFMTDDKRVKAYGYCELHFFPNYYNSYGVWHRIKSHGSRIAWGFLCDYLKTHEEYSCYIDDQT